KRLLPAVLGDIAANDPRRTFISVPDSSDLSQGSRDIDYGTFGKAVDKYAYWLRAQLKDSSELKPILFLGPLDIRYLLVLLVTPKAGHITHCKLPSALLKAHQSIAERAGCETILVSKGAPTLSDQILKTMPLKQILLPLLGYFFENLDKVKHIPFTLTWEEANDKPFCVLHTSDSTGIPKFVFVTHGTFACNDAHQLIPQLGGKPTLINFLKGKRSILALPLFHAAFPTFPVGYNIFAGVICVVPPPKPPSANMMNLIYWYADPDGALLSPSLIVDCFNNPEYYENMLLSLKSLSYVGGALPEEVRNEVTKRIKLMTLMGSCETALHPLEINEYPSNWQYLTISEYLGHTFVEHKDEYHELVIKRDPKRELFQGVFSTFPEKNIFTSGDPFEQHPARLQSWVFRARTDDIIAFTTLNPITMDSTISTNPKIKSAVIGGQGKFKASLIIEPYIYPKSVEEEDQLIKDIWPSVLQANRSCPPHSRIMKGLVMLTSLEKPIPRSRKGTVQHHAALQLYKAEFEGLYDMVQST
ncbi:acetyl-CoA synthetase-like protein, partial [Melanomma pulvis-pyrius CBS 109.77]